MILKVKTPPDFWTIFDKSSLCAATDADFDRRSRLQTRRTFAQQKPKRKWGPDAMCHEKRTTLFICLTKIKRGISPNIYQYFTVPPQIQEHSLNNVLPILISLKKTFGLILLCETMQLALFTP